MNLVCLVPVSAQHELDKWYFGPGLNFTHGGKPSLVTNMVNGTKYREGTTSICDKNGSLLFYSDGDTVFNRKHQPMAGINIDLGRNNYSAIQSCIALPVRGNEGFYYLIRGISGEATSMPKRHFDCVVIDMAGDGGLGEIVGLKNINEQFWNTNDEGFAVASHSSGIDYWLIFRGKSSPQQYRAYRISPTGAVTDSVFHNLDVTHLPASLAMKASPNSNFFARPHVLKGNETGMSLFRFDNSTGVLSDQIFIPAALYPRNQNGYFNSAFEFSSDSKKLYAVFQEPSGDQSIFQYDLSDWNKGAVASSKIAIGTGKGICGLQLGPDKKIYVFSKLSGSLGVINNPKSEGLGCDYKPHSIDLSPKRVGYGSPYYPSFWFGDSLIINVPRRLVKCIGDSIQITVESNRSASYLWNTGDTTQSIYVHDTGWFQVVAYTKSDTITDSVYVSEGPKQKVYLGPDTTYCGDFLRVLKTSTSFERYKWNTGDTTGSITINEDGTFSVWVADSNACQDSDTIEIGRIEKPNVSIHQDTVTCKYTILSITNTSPGTRYSWSTGDTTRRIEVDKKGQYFIKVYNAHCWITDSVEVDILPEPNVYLGEDTTLCHGNLILSVNKIGAIHWSTGETTQQIAVQPNTSDDPISIWVEIVSKGCTGRDTLELLPCEKTICYLPNAISLNGDQLNEVFKPIGLTNVVEYQFSIYNRWGEMIFTSGNPEDGWDGTYSDKLVPTGAYLYLLRATTSNKMIINQSGTVTVLR
ncbi:MAG: gliding motility-associated C-terminal domain-containing protein [Bacteroidia bacterium]|nr:gliding motility-associated C-terminal domain-containing protein [Bacteroidia bacterium]